MTSGVGEETSFDSLLRFGDMTAANWRTSILMKAYLRIN